MIHFVKAEGNMLQISVPNIELVSIFGGALVGAVLAQILAYYRISRRRFEELKSILRLIEQFDDEEMVLEVDRGDAFIWYLRDELYRSYKENVLFLGDYRHRVEELIYEFPSRSMDRPSGYLEPNALKEKAREAETALDSIDPLDMAELYLKSFLGL